MLNRRSLIHAVNIVCILIIGLLSLQLVAGWCEFHKDSGKVISADKVLCEKKTVEIKPLSYYSTIAEKKLFRKTAESRPRIVPVETKSSFRLKGTMVLDSGRGYAILEDAATGAQRLYKLGGKVGNSRLISINWGRVVLKGSGEEKVLAMVSAVPGDVSRIPVKEVKKEEIKQIAGNKRILSRSFVEEAAANVNLILTQVRIKPHFVSGASQGYWVGNIRPGSIIEEMGIRNGDIIKRINGQVLDSPEKIFKVYAEIQDTGVVVVDVERDNNIETLTYEIRD